MHNLLMHIQTTHLTALSFATNLRFNYKLLTYYAEISCGKIYFVKLSFVIHTVFNRTLSLTFAVQLNINVAYIVIIFNIHVRLNHALLYPERFWLAESIRDTCKTCLSGPAPPSPRTCRTCRTPPGFRLRARPFHNPSGRRYMLDNNLNRHCPDDLQVCGDHTPVPPSREPYPLCSHPMA